MSDALKLAERLEKGTSGRMTVREHGIDINLRFDAAAALRELVAELAAAKDDAFEKSARIGNLRAELERVRAERDHLLQNTRRASRDLERTEPLIEHGHEEYIDGCHECEVEDAVYSAAAAISNRVTWGVVGVPLIKNEAEAESARLREALGKRQAVGHATDCPSQMRHLFRFDDGAPTHACTCGFDEAAALLEAK